MNLAVKVGLALGGSLMLAGWSVHSKHEAMQSSKDWEEFSQCRKRLGKDVSGCKLDWYGVTWTFRQSIDSLAQPTTSDL
jgi:hypothetical protein